MLDVVEPRLTILTDQPKSDPIPQTRLPEVGLLGVNADLYYRLLEGALQSGTINQLDADLVRYQLIENLHWFWEEDNDSRKTKTLNRMSYLIEEVCGKSLRVEPQEAFAQMPLAMEITINLMRGKPIIGAITTDPTLAERFEDPDLLKGYLKVSYPESVNHRPALMNAQSFAQKILKDPSRHFIVFR